MFVRMKHNADKFMKEAEKIRQVSPEKKPLSPNRKPADAPAIVVTPTPAVNSNVAPGVSAPPSPDKSRSAEKPKERVQEPSSNKVFYGFAAAADLGFGLYVGYRLYQGDAVEAMPVDAPAKPQV